MDSPQYGNKMKYVFNTTSFKPYYKWIVLNTKKYYIFKDPIKKF